jgi:hypothetical protein
MDPLLRIASPLGLYAEEYGPPTGRNLGNFCRHSCIWRSYGVDHRPRKGLGVPEMKKIVAFDSLAPRRGKFADVAELTWSAP